MNVLTTPKWLTRPVEPTAPPLPPAPRAEDMRQMTMDFMNTVDRQREENAWLRTENEQMRVELQATKETMRLLESEINFVRDQHDRLQRHDATITAGVEHLMLICNKLLAQSRAEAYAPPGSGQQEQPETEQDQQTAAVLAERLAPENSNA